MRRKNNYRIIIGIVIIIGLVALMSVPQTSAQTRQNGDLGGSENWSMNVSNHVIWIGEELVINVTGFASTLVKVSLDCDMTNTSYFREAITDENGTAVFRFDDFYTEKEGRYLVQLFVEGGLSPVIMDVIDINYDEIVYLFMLLEKWELYFEVDMDDWNPIFDRSLEDKFNSLRQQTMMAQEMAEKSFTMWIFTVLGLLLPYNIIVWLFWDEISAKWDKKRLDAGLSESRMKAALTLKNPRVDHEGMTIHTRVPTFDDGRTKEEREAQRRRIMKKLKLDPETVEMISIDDTMFSDEVKAFFALPIPDPDKEEMKRLKDLYRWQAKTRKIRLAYEEERDELQKKIDDLEAE